MCLKKRFPRTTRKGLMRRTLKSSLGFSLLELMISAAIGAVLIVTAADLFSRAMKASWITSQKSELQQDFRAASNLLQRDISMAGAGALGQQGLSTSAVGLPASTGTLPVYPCSGLVTCNYINGAPVAYPTATGAPTVPFIYSIIPGPNLGITINAAQGPTDIITVISADVTLALNCYSSSINAAATTVTFQLPAGPPWPATCVLPNGTLRTSTSERCRDRPATRRYDPVGQQRRGCGHRRRQHLCADRYEHCLLHSTLRRHGSGPYQSARRCHGKPLSSSLAPEPPPLRRFPIPQCACWQSLTI